MIYAVVDYYYSHFVDEETNSSRGLCEVTQAGISGVRIKIQVL